MQCYVYRKLILLSVHAHLRAKDVTICVNIINGSHTQTHSVVLSPSYYNSLGFLFLSFFSSQAANMTKLTVNRLLSLE